MPRIHNRTARGAPEMNGQPYFMKADNIHVWFSGLGEGQTLTNTEMKEITTSLKIRDIRPDLVETKPGELPPVLNARWVENPLYVEVSSHEIPASLTKKIRERIAANLPPGKSGPKVGPGRQTARRRRQGKV